MDPRYKPSHAERKERLNLHLVTTIEAACINSFVVLWRIRSNEIGHIFVLPGKRNVLQ